MQQFIKGVLGSLVVHVLFALLAFGLVFWYTSEYAFASEALLLELADADDADAQVLIYLETARQQLATWIWPAMGVSFLCSILFLGLADRHMPSNPTEAGSKKGLWTVLLIVNVVIAIIIWFVAVSMPDTSYSLIFSNYAVIILVTFLLLLLGYFLSTAFFVKRTMARSVPLAPMMRGVS